MRGQGGTLRVRNLAQKVLWEQELTGQLSDGRWENSRPNDHWEPWCDATCVVDPENVGRNFYVKRDGYCFTERELLSIIGERMLEAVRVLTSNPAYSEQDMLTDLRDLRKIIKIKVSVPTGVPIPPQPEGREVKLLLDGYPQVRVVYNAAEVNDDPRAVAALEERRRQNAEYRVKSLQAKVDQARAALTKAEAELAAAVNDAGMIV
jgi:hypothetical protein